MTDYCSVCGKKLGIFDRKYDVLDENGNRVKCCKDCKIAHEEKIRKENTKVMKIDERIIPAYKAISKKLGENPVTIEIIKEFLKMPLDYSTPVINIMRISRLLSKFNIKEDEKTMGKILEKLSEEAELEEFEEKLM